MRGILRKNRLPETEELVKLTTQKEKSILRTKSFRLQAIALIVFILAISQAGAYAGFKICRDSNGHLAFDFSQHCQTPIMNECGLFFIENSARQDRCHPCEDTKIATDWAMSDNSRVRLTSFAFSTTGAIRIANLLPLQFRFTADERSQSGSLNDRCGAVVLRI